MANEKRLIDANALCESFEKAAYKCEYIDDMVFHLDYILDEITGADEVDNCDSLLMVTKNRMNGKILTGDNAIKLYYSQKSKRVVSDPTATKEYGCFREPGYVHHSWIDELEPL